MPYSFSPSHRSNVVVLTVVTVVLLGSFLSVELRTSGGELGVPLDDAWIHYQFARNLGQGDGFSFNPGEPTPGSTAPLWTVMLAGVALITENLLLPSLLLSASFLVLTVLLTYGFAFALLENRLTAMLAALGTAVTGRLLWAGLAGMETTLFAALSMAALWAHSRNGLRPLTALLFGLASQVRPEGHALFALAFADSLWAGRQLTLRGKAKLPGVIRTSGKALAIYVAIAAPYLLFSLTTTGHPLPNTFYAKVGSQHFFSWRTLQETLRLHWHDNPIGMILVFVGIPPAWRRSRLLVAWLIALPVLTAVIVDFVWHHGRYTMPLVPFQMTVAAAGIQFLLRRLKIGDRGTTVTDQIPGNGATVLLAMLLIIGGLGRVPHWANMLGTNVKEILEVDVSLGAWLAANTPTEALIAVDDIGAIGYLSRRRVIDMNGLISPQIWPALRAEVGLPRNQIATRILSREDPDYMVGFPLWHWEIATNPDVAEPIHRAQTETRTIIGEREAVVYRTTWPYLEQASPNVRLQATFGQAIHLVGFDLATPVRGEPLGLVLYWESLGAVTAEYDVFIHVLNIDREIVTQADQKPVRGLASTHLWQSGDIIRDPYHLDHPRQLPAGTYEIRVGLFLRETGERLVASGPDSLGNAIKLATFDWGL